MNRKHTITAVLVVALAAIVAAIAGSGDAAVKAGPTLTIWTDADRQTAVTQVANKWGAARGVQINVVQKHSRRPRHGRRGRRTRCHRRRA